MNKKAFRIFSLFAFILITILIIVLYIYFNKKDTDADYVSYVPFHILVKITYINDELIEGIVLEDNDHYKTGDGIKIYYSKEIVSDVRNTDLETGWEIRVIYHSAPDSEGNIYCDGAPEIINP